MSRLLQYITDKVVFSYHNFQLLLILFVCSDEAKNMIHKIC